MFAARLPRKVPLSKRCSPGSSAAGIDHPDIANVAVVCGYRRTGTTSARTRTPPSTSAAPRLDSASSDVPGATSVVRKSCSVKRSGLGAAKASPPDIEDHARGLVEGQGHQ
jgi:hypothetical protein